MKYDDASWHYNGDFPTDLPVEAGATHIGLAVMHPQRIAPDTITFQLISHNI